MVLGLRRRWGGGVKTVGIKQRESVDIGDAEDAATRGSWSVKLTFVALGFRLPFVGFGGYSKHLGELILLPPPNKNIRIPQVYATTTSDIWKVIISQGK
ncbi:hypothetical protein LINGRAHAP2_LOCUS26325 [Linum grandiflorum]